MFQKISKPIKIIVGIAIFIGLFFLLYETFVFEIYEYGDSPRTRRLALLEEVPVGSSVEDVYEFMKRHHISKRNFSDLLYDEEYDYHFISLIAYSRPLDLHTSMWLIHFEFDENYLLENIRFVGLYP